MRSKRVLDLPLNIIAETNDLLVVNKPPSLPVHACGQYAIHTVLGQLRYNHNRSGLRVLHRLDRTTSGVLLFAKNYETDVEVFYLRNWANQYLSHMITEFLQFFSSEEVECNEPIGVLVISMGIQCVRADGKPARSLFKKLWSDGKRSVLSVKLYTGRTHQIRVHAQFLGYPIVGDQLYNSTVWGPQKGKGAEYCKSYSELCDDVRNAHKCSNWHETIDPEYELRMAKMADEEVTIPATIHVPSVLDRPLYDPICLNCNVVKREVPRDHFQLYLHCLRYSTEKWSYSTPIPEWAIDAEQLPSMKHCDFLGI
ncbi:unnamed protein product [Angiostrongylus costaricensis]|uniref:PseudoU_synth_2 domain-containing protein n=1 Tax=Angiostrongylus costaricensis TaxID=334426 RepID=A0A0R3PAY3_ANGCS|nr:unnamed protein product [Angiostrongylus costaricensis]